MRSQTDPNPKILLCKSLPQRLPLGSGKDILNWCFQGYAEFCFSRIYEACVDAECHSCQAPVAVGLKRPPPSGDRWLRPVDPNRLVPGTRWGATMATGWKPIPRWRQAGSLSCDGDRLEAYPTVVVSRYLDCKICELTEDLSLALDVIPQDKTIEIVAAGEEHPPLGLLGHAVRKADVFLGL